MRKRRFLFVLALASGSLASLAHADQIIDGRKAWLRLNCYGCHGSRAQGGMGPSVRTADYYGVLAALSGSSVSGGMRSYSGIATNTDAANIAAYLAVIGTAREPKWFDWWRR